MSNDTNPTVFNTIEEALTAIRQGEMVMVVDDDDRENEGDLVIPHRWQPLTPLISWLRMGGV